MLDLAEVKARAAELAGRIAGFHRGRLRVAGYRLNYSEGRTALLGIHDSRTGDVYAPFQLREEVQGQALVAWSDGRLSLCDLDGNGAGNRGASLGAAADTRYRDDHARVFAARTRVPATPIYHAAVERTVAGRFRPLYDTVDLIRERARHYEVKKVAGSARASVGASVICTSAGLAYAALSTEQAYAFRYGAELYAARWRRRPIPLGEARKVIDRAATLLPALTRRLRRRRTGRARVLLMPSFAADLVETFVIDNLYGADAVSGQSPFRPDDFKRHTRVLRADMRLVVDPTVPYSSGSYRMTSEGRPAKREVYIDRGRLRRPIVGFKYARRLGARPSTPPSSMESVDFTAAGAITEPRARELAGDGLMVLSALGVHTQDAASGDFSLTAPQAVVLQAGEPVGHQKVVLAGNFFAALNAPETKLVRVAGHRFPALLIEADVTSA